MALGGAFFKTRSLATDAVAGGRIHVNETRVKPSKEVQIGDVVEITIGPLRRTVHVTGVAERRGSAQVAATLYEETPESVEARERFVAERRLARPMAPTSARARRSSHAAGSMRSPLPAQARPAAVMSGVMAA